ncbi:MAG: ankyrin repeat domain-containing protein, partial [Syntrophorhabdales bacterium]
MRSNHHIKVHSFFSRFCRPPVLRFAVVTLVALLALAWGSPAFCGEIHDAAEQGDVRKVEALLKGNPDLVLSKDDSGDTPLHWAALNGHKEVAELLLARKADVDAKNNDGNTPLQWAAQGGHKDVAELLLAHKAQVDAADISGVTPLHEAAFNGHR